MSDTCRSCGAAITWAKTRADKSMPLNPKPDADGNMGLVDGLTFSVANAPDYKGLRYTSHFSDCPNAKQHRRAK